MSKSKTKISAKKKVVVAGKNTKTIATAAKKVQPTRSRRKSSGTVSAAPQEMILGKQNYILMAAGFGLILLGMLLMMGGNMPSPEVWDENIIYSWRRTVLAPFVMIVGLIVEVYAIFKK